MFILLQKTINWIYKQRWSHKYQVWLMRYFKYYHEDSANRTMMMEWSAKSMLLIILFIFFSGILSYIFLSIDWLLFGLISTFALILYRVKKMQKNFASRVEKIYAELPFWLSTILIRLICGDSAQIAFINSAQKSTNSIQSPLHYELTRITQKLSNNYSLAMMLEQLNQRCTCVELSQITTHLLMYQQRGGSHLIQSLRDQNLLLWQKRKTYARKKAQEASSKLVFPMMLIFITMLTIVATPALFMFNQS